MNGPDRAICCMLRSSRWGASGASATASMATAAGRAGASAGRPCMSRSTPTAGSPMSKSCPNSAGHRTRHSSSGRSLGSRPGGITTRRVMSDNGSGSVSRAWRATCATLQLRHLRTRAYTPRTNGKAERFIQTLLREWAYVEPYASSQERRTALRSYLRFYNRQRPHASLNSQPPWSRPTSAA